jgi:hypothetical protein
LNPPKPDIPNKYLRFTPEGDRALAIVAQLAEDIAAAWETLRRNVAGGMAFGAAVILFMQAVRDLLRAAYTEVWVIGRGEDFEGEQEFSNVENEVAVSGTEMETYLQKVGDEAELLENNDDVFSLLGRRLSRVVFFAGKAWTMFNMAKVFSAAARDIWTWAGPVDKGTCDVCREEMALGPRPLGEILRYPGRDTICLDNCRHELVKVN